ncbi:SPT3 Dosage dependent suppressor of Ty-induced promoter mutations-like protein [Maudiozyma exigua]|uniref:SPT3 Dosage dependent suppressor of Ty-induced promoter mutations-like protein n=1 Tax=Maudiozyma exigua TaxID=34358 RepID=A0A9P7BC88_MAUEX|nr:SPT3 Dosage dependent suppressor of Ty-induced promoter mutations-like protein [Kazachstania exigua]
MMHLPADCIAKEKLYLTNDETSSLPPGVADKMVHLEAYLLCATTLTDTSVCKRCVERELRRASRRKSGLSDNLLWCNNPHRRAIIFKNRQVMTGTSRTGSLEFDLVARIVCYSRHHKSKEGFKILFVVRDSLDGNVLAKTLTHPIVIVDKKLPSGVTPPTSSSSKNVASTSSSLAEMFTSNQLFLSSELESSSPFGNSVPLPSPSSLSEDSISMKRPRTSIDSTNSSSWQDVLSNITMPELQDDSQLPTIQRIIPAQGPMNGGIEITLLGKNFKQGQRIKFGENIALSTQCWNDSTMVTYLPPASTAGQVVVTIEEKPGTLSQINAHQLASLQIAPQSPQTVNLNAIFTYIDETDRQLIELALQIVGLKMNGKLEDARNIAKRIVGTNSNGNSPTSMPSTTSSTSSNSSTAAGYTDDESLIVNVLNSFKLGTKNLNLSVCDQQGRTLLHHAALKSYHTLMKTLISYGAHVEKPDMFGFTPLHLACIAGDFKTIQMLYEGCHCDPNVVTGNGMTAKILLWNNHRLKWSNMFNDSNDAVSLKSLSSYTDLQTDPVVVVPKVSEPRYSDDEFADDEIESDTQDRNVLTDTEDQTSLWNRMVTKLNKNDLLPKYEDLFPRSLLDLNPKVQQQVQQVQQQEEPVESSEEEDTLDDLDDLKNSVQQFFVQQRTKFQNDSMLLFFWIPLMVILICSMTLYTLGHDDNPIKTLGDTVSKYLRMGLSYIILGNERMTAVVRKQLQTFQNPHLLPDMMAS